MIARSVFLAGIASSLLACPVASQQPPEDGPGAPVGRPPQSPPRPQGPGQPGDGPWNHRILLATSADGLAWKIDPAVLAERASVPEMFLGPDGRPVLLFVDASGGSRRGALGALARQADGSWARREADLRGADPNVVRLKGGDYCAYTKEPDGAILVFSSRDGLRWEPLGEAFRDARYRNATDSDVFETPDGWVMLISLGPKLLRCTSGDGLRFTTVGELLDLGGSVSDTVAAPGGWRTYFHVNADRRTGGKMLIRSAFTADGRTWKVEDGDRVVAPADGPARLGVADPAPLRLPDGSWLMAVKSFVERPAFGGPFAADAGAPPGPGRGFEGQDRGFPRPPRDDPGIPNNADGPWNRDVIAYRVGDAGAVEKVATFARAGVPTIARLKDGRLIVAHQHFPEGDRANFDKVAVRFSGDDGRTWTEPRVIRLDGLPEGYRSPFDPTLVPLPDGRVRLYFTSLKGRRFDEDQPAIYSAISDDGVDYSFEPGTRFGVEGRPVIDCAVVLHRGVFHLYAPDNGTSLQPGRRPDDQPADARPRPGFGYHATSRDGLDFTRAEDVQIDGRRSWLGNAQSDGELITFFGTGDPGPPDPGRQRGGVWLATSADGQAWRPASGPAILGGDPGAVKALDGGWLVVITGEPRAGAPGARPGRSHRPDGPPGQPGFGPPPDVTTADLLNRMWSRGRATGEGPVRLQGFPLRLEDIGSIIPMGLMQGGHTTPSDHLYLVPVGAMNQTQGNDRGQGRGTRKDDRDFSRLYDVVAVADGSVVALQWRPNPPGGQGRFDPTVFDRAVDLKVVIEHSSTCWSYVDHLVGVDESIMKQVPGGVQPGQPVPVRIPVRAGQVIGKVGNQTFDFALIDTATMRQGFVRPEQFLRRDPWKPHTVDPFDSIDEPLRGKLMAKVARKVPPFGGRIDYDVDGKLVGNWYEEGTGGYAGLDRRIDYWVGHLSIAYHHLDPKIIVVSIGNYDGRAVQFWVKGNAPDPASIGEGDGVVKYELIYGQLGSAGQPQRRPEGEEVQGTVLAQVLPGRKLRFEAFRGKTAGEIGGFTAAARTYER